MKAFYLGYSIVLFIMTTFVVLELPNINVLPMDWAQKVIWGYVFVVGYLTSFLMFRKSLKK